MKKLNRKGFTLIELLAVIVILAIVVVVTIPSVISSINKAKTSSLENATATVTEWFTKQYELETLNEVSGGASKEYKTFFGNAGLTDTEKLFPMTGEGAVDILKAAGITNTTDLSGSVKLNNGKVCVKLTAGEDSQFYVKNASNNNTVTGSGC